MKKLNQKSVLGVGIVCLSANALRHRARGGGDKKALYLATLEANFERFKAKEERALKEVVLELEATIEKLQKENQVHENYLTRGDPIPENLSRRRALIKKNNNVIGKLNMEKDLLYAKHAEKIKEAAKIYEAAVSKYYYISGRKER